MELMVPRIMKFFLILVSTKDFLELSVDELCLLLKSNYICVNRYTLLIPLLIEQLRIPNLF